MHSGNGRTFAMDSNRNRSARRWSAVASVVLVIGAVLVAVTASGAARAEAQALPSNTVPPTVSGTPAVGQTLTANAGTWTGTPTSFSYRWWRCSGSCAVISGAMASSYTVVAGDAGSRLMVGVVASNGDGASPEALSAQTSEVTAAGPSSTSDPVVSGSPVQGQTLTTTTGGWSSSSTVTFTFQWVRCGTDGGTPSGSNCPAVPGGTGQTYKLDDDDVGHRMRARVTATNSAGSTSAASNATAVVQASATGSGPARNTKEPTVSGTPQQGQTLTANGGSWTGVAPVTLTYQWVRCGADGGKADASNCATIARATNTTYVLAAADVGQRLRVKVTGRNSQGSSTAASNPTAAVQGTGPTLPPGAVRLANGKYSIPATSVALPARLVVDGIRFTPNPVRSRGTAIELRVHVSDTRGYSVRDVLVFARSTPLVTSAAGEQPTGQDGWATIRLTPKRTFPLRRGYSVQFFVRARKQGDNILAGISTRRLVQVRTAR
jgi:hypothetical protein